MGTFDRHCRSPAGDQGGVYEDRNRMRGKRGGDWKGAVCFQCCSLQGAVKFLRCRLSAVAVRTLTDRKTDGFVEKTSRCVLVLVYAVSPAGKLTLALNLANKHNCVISTKPTYQTVVLT